MKHGSKIGLLVLVLVFGMVSFTSAELVGYWDFNDNTNDFSGNNNNLLNNNCSFGDGITGKAIVTNNSYLINETMANFSLAPGSISLSAWVRISKLTGDWQTIMEYDRYNAGGPKTSWFGIWVSPEDKFHLRVGHSSNWHTVYESKSNKKLETNRWYYLTGTFNESLKEGVLYVDGKENGYFNLTDLNRSSLSYWSAPSTSILTMGKSKRGNVTAEPLYGRIDEVKVFSNVLSAEDVLDEYNSIIPHEISINLTSPVDGFETEGKYNLSASANVTGYHNLTQCILYIDSSESANTSTIINNTVSFLVEDLAAGTYKWYIECSDDYNNSNKSETMSFEVKASDISSRRRTSSFRSSSSDDSVVCGEWSECGDSGIQRRTCGEGFVTRSCGAIFLNNDPSGETDQSGKVSIGSGNEGTGFFSLITGNVIGNIGTTGNSIIGILILIVLGALLIVIMKKRKAKRSKK